MLTILLILSLLIWFPILLFQLNQRGLVILLIWIFTAPVILNLVEKPGENPFFDNSVQQEQKSKSTSKRKRREDSYLKGETTITMRDVFEPTRILLGTFLIVFVVGDILQRKRLMNLDRTETCMAVFLVVVYTSVLLQSRRLAFGLHVALDAFTVPFLAYFTARRLFRNEDSFRKLVQVITYTGVYLIISGLIERVMNTDLTYRLKGPFDFRDAFYIVIMVVFFAVLVEWISTSANPQRRGLSRGMEIFVLGFAPIIILFIWTRGVWLGFLGGIWTFAFLSRTLVAKRRKLLALGLVFGLFPIVLLGLHELTTVEDASERVFNVSTAYGRWITYQVMVEEWTHNPVFGIGLNNLRDVLTVKRISAYDTRSYIYTHQSYLSMLAELGAVGLLAYLAMAWSVLGIGVRLSRMGMHPKDRWRGIGLVAIIVAYLIPPMFDGTLYKTWLSHIYVFVYAGALAGVYAQKAIGKQFMYSSQTRVSALHAVGIRAEAPE